MLAQTAATPLLERPRVIVAHPYKQHSFQTASALAARGMLEAYLTTVYLKQDNMTWQLKKLVSKGNKARLDCHKHDELDYYVKQFSEFAGLLKTGINRVPSLSRMNRIFEDCLFKQFGKQVAEYAIQSSADAVVMYDTTARECFYRLKQQKPEINRVLDMSALTVPSRIKAYRNDAQFDYYMGDSEVDRLWGKEKLFDKRYLDELALADFFLVASSITKSDLLARGIDESRICIIPYGTNHHEGVTAKEDRHYPLRLLFAGGISFQKGLHHLIDSVKGFESEEILLDIVGADVGGKKLHEAMRSLPNVNYLGYVPYSRMPSCYADHDVLVSASLSDGFGFTVVEAMAHGLPTIVSSMTGIASSLRDNKGCVVYDAYNAGELSDAIRGFLCSSESFKIRSKAALSTSESLTWDAYAEKLTGFFVDMHNRK